MASTALAVSFSFALSLTSLTAMSLCATSLTAQLQQGQWQPTPALNAPPALNGATLTPWDNGELLLFGGDSAVPVTSEWAWNGVSWRAVNTPVPHRISPAVGRNDGDGSLLVFGGTLLTGGQVTDTWQYANGTWSQLTPPNAPPAMDDMSMAYDQETGGMLLLGLTSSGNFETWRFVAGDWSLVNSIVAGLTPWASLVTDSVRREVLMVQTGLAGLSISRLLNNGWNGIGGDPVVLLTAWSAFDQARGCVVVAGATAAGMVTREWDGLAFRAAPNTPGLSPAAPSFAIAYHAARQEMVLVNGNPALLETWRLAPNATPQAVPIGTPCQDPTFVLGLAAGSSPQPGTSHLLRTQGANGSFVTFSALGFSFTHSGFVSLPWSLPISTQGCLLRVDPVFLAVLGFGQPASQLVTLANTPNLLGVRYAAQFLQFDSTGILDTSNALDVQIGQPLPENSLTETFASAANRDAAVSGDLWSNGQVTPTAIGGDGRHGSFDATFGTALGGNVYEWNTDNQLIPASATLSGLDEVVTDGRFYFTDFVVPAGVTVRFVGSVPVQVFVRGRVDVQGTIDISGRDLPWVTTPYGPAAGLHLSSFNSRTIFLTPLDGELGSAGGPGGGSGGQGGRKCLSAGPIVVNGVAVTDGQPGEDVHLQAGHAYAGSAAGTGGRGSQMWPASGLADNTVIIGSLYRGFFSRGGSGGGFLLPGNAPTATLNNASIAPASAPGAAFPLLPYPGSPPPGYSSLAHFLIGGSGGGGGGSHSFGTFTFTGDQYLAGHGGSGGGGAMLIRAGGDLSVSPIASLRSRGGDGVVINGDNVANNVATPTLYGYDITYGIGSPGGGGSGGSFVLQSAHDVLMAGGIDTSGGPGSRAGYYVLNPQVLNIQAQAGAGSPGFYRLEGGNGVAFTGTGVPAFVQADNVGVLDDRDDRTGSRSTWLLPSSSALPVYLRYELLVAVNGSTVLYSDDPNVSSVRADDPNGAVRVRFQGALIDALSGNVVPSTIGPWRDSVLPGEADSINRDRAKAIRFDLGLNKSIGVVRVLELRILYR